MPVGRENSDEAFGLALCDMVLDEVGVRQHRFNWLRGDSSPTGRLEKLPVVDGGYWPHANVVVEYRENAAFAAGAALRQA